MKVILIGYGRMGKTVHELIKEDKFTEVAGIYDENKLLSVGDNLEGVDVAIDFSEAQCVIDNLKILAGKKINCVLGTTGWYDKMIMVNDIVKQGNTGLIWDSNFSIGVNLFFEVARYASDLFGRFEHYDVSISEVHHKGKKDSPSGTAIILGNIILETNSKKKKIQTDKVHGLIEGEALHVTSSRFGSVFGKHSVYFDSPQDSFELTHNAKSREGFAVGALLAAKWIKGKSGIYRMKDVLESKD
ncbi:MAG: 4-hydroxy-tetrahydrodipicolinate reductase [Armatimonadota bacterium]